MQGTGRASQYHGAQRSREGGTNRLLLGKVTRCTEHDDDGLILQFDGAEL